MQVWSKSIKIFVLSIFEWPFYTGLTVFIRFGSKLYRQIVGTPMGTNCAPLCEDLFLFCYERYFMLSLSDNNQLSFEDLTQPPDI